MTKEEFERIRPLSKEEYEKWKMEQIKLEMQSPLYIEAPVDFLNILKEKLIGCDKLLTDYSQECEGTFKIKDGNVTDIHLTGIALIPRFKDGENNDRKQANQ